MRTRSHSGLGLIAAVSVAALALLPGSSIAQHGTDTARDTIAAEAGVEIAGDLAVHLYAEYPMLASPVAISAEDGGAVYVTETNRRKSSNLDIRDHRNWMIEDLSLTTIGDKRRFYRRMLAPDSSAANSPWLPDRNGDGSHDWRDLTVESERIHRIVDGDGDGRADSSTVFAENFRGPVTGVAAGVLAADSSVYATVAPDLWRLRDRDGDGRSESRRPLSTGYGVHLSFAGHDMSGLVRGPDGKIYWSIGDIGLNVVGPDGRRWKYPNQGAVMRMNPDGSDFEVFAHGLRNPQELAFDRHGNLFSVDNDGDHAGEHERIVYITDGSDAGWRTNWQFGKYSDPEHSAYNVWMDEQLHVPHFEEQAAYVTPAVAEYRNGPSGFAYNPGTALNERWEGFFFSSHFTGSAAQSHVSAFRVQPSGAGFELGEVRDVVRGLLLPSIDFGPAGDLYLADWIEGWDVQERGRVWRVTAPGPSDRARETARLLRAGVEDRSSDRLERLLAHPDMRVRMQAQFELAERGPAGEKLLRRTAIEGSDRLARLHAIWGLGQFGEEDPSRAAPLVDLLEDPDAEVRAQSAKVLGEAGHRPAVDPLVDALDDPAPRVRFFSAIALGELGAERAIDPLVAMLDRNDGADPYLRHAGAEGLARIGHTGRIGDLTDHPSSAVRRAATVALRDLQSAVLADFLSDPDPLVVTEAARGIHDDFSIPDALPRLAALLDENPPGGEALYRRLINANFRLGGSDEAERLARFAGREGASAGLRVEAIIALRQWPDPPALDRVTGRYRGLRDRPATTARSALAPHVESLMSASADTIRTAAVRAIGELGYGPAADRLFVLLEDTGEPAAVRIAALRALSRLEVDEIDRAVEIALGSGDDSLREAGLALVPEMDASSEVTAGMMRDVLSNGTLDQRREAFRILGELEGGAADSVLSDWMDRLLDDRVPPGLQYDLLGATRERTSPTLERKQKRYRAQLPEDPIANYLSLLYGGDPGAGRTIFFQNSSAQCVRCHRVGERGGGEAGPELTDIGARRDRRHLMESLVRPGAEIAPGYGSVSAVLKDGRRVSGVYRGGTSDSLRIGGGSGPVTTVARSQIDALEFGPSSMPSMGAILSDEQLRDVVAFLATLDGEREN